MLINGDLLSELDKRILKLCLIHERTIQSIAQYGQELKSSVSIRGVMQ